MQFIGRTQVEQRASLSTLARCSTCVSKCGPRIMQSYACMLPDFLKSMSYSRFRINNFEQSSQMQYPTEYHSALFISDYSMLHATPCCNSKNLCKAVRRPAQLAVQYSVIHFPRLRHFSALVDSLRYSSRTRTSPLITLSLHLPQFQHLPRS